MQVDSALLQQINWQPNQVPIIGFVINLVLAAGLGVILRDLFIRYGRTMGNRRLLAANFILLIITTMFIITVVKSSLALSLGLVGALSIVRFRTAIKEPEELAYLFLALAVGLGLGAGQTLITLISFFFLVVIIWLQRLFSRQAEDSSVYLTVSCANQPGLLPRLVDVIKKYCQSVNLRRHDENDSRSESIFIVDFVDWSQMAACQEALRQLDHTVRVSMLDNRGSQ